MVSTLVTPPVYKIDGTPDPIFVYGEPLVTVGLENHGVINGLGLVTRGLLWQLYDLWSDKDYYSNITTTWSATYNATITTTWTSPQYGMFGSYPTI